MEISEVANQETTPPRFSLVVPCYNEGEALPEAVLNLRKIINLDYPYEIIAVDDGSTDATAEKLIQAQAEDPSLVILTHDQNSGYGSALKTGIRHAKSDLIVITDADGTYPNERIGELVELGSRYDMVVGSRTAPDVQYSKIRKIPKIFLGAYASWIAGRKIPDINSGLRVFRKDVVQKYSHLLSNQFSFTTTSTLALLTNGYRVHYEPIGYSPRIGKSHIKPIRDTLRFVQLIVRMGMYFAPLRVFAPFILLLGLGFTASFCYDVFVLKNLTDKTVILMISAMNTTFFALIADMIDKRGRR
jgi:glycosyltransferase involved in cell wall biosynthesis